jgi:cytochrome c oxidase subunit 4
MATQPTTRHASARKYFLVFGGLLVLTALTVLAANPNIELGRFHAVVALAIAGCKATLVVLFFMHALESDKLVHLILLAALLWLAIMLGFTLCDYVSRPVDYFYIRNAVPV